MAESNAPVSAAPEVVAPDGMTMASGTGEPSGTNGSAGLSGTEGILRDDESANEIESPAKIIRIGSMVKQLLEEVRNTSLDEAARDRLASIYANSKAELRTAISDDLGAELDRLTLDFAEGSVPSEAELRVAQAQLVGWLEGLFHGIQATLMAQQMVARQQLEGMRSQLPEGLPKPSVGGPGYI